MTFSDNLEKIKNEIAEFLKKTTYEVEIEILSPKDNTIFVNLKSEDPKVLIGEKGETLLAIQHILKIILKRKLDIKDSFYLDIDINNYKKKKYLYLKELARSVAQEVILAKKEKILPPMPAYERRIIHLELADNPNIRTESIGEEPERKIIIKPYP